MSNSTISTTLLHRRCHIHPDNVGGDPYSLEYGEGEGTIVGVRYGLWPNMPTEQMIASVRWDEKGRVVDLPICLLFVAKDQRETKSRKTALERFPVDTGYLNGMRTNALAAHLRKKAKASPGIIEMVPSNRGRPKGSTKKTAKKKAAKKAPKKKAAKKAGK